MNNVSMILAVNAEAIEMFEWPLKQVYRRRYESRRSSKPKLH